MRAVELQGAAAAFGGRTVWSDVDLAADAGSFVVVLGPNGAGKTTLLRAIVGTLPLARGRVSVFGRPPQQVRPEIGYLPQRHALGPAARLRGLDIVRLGLDGHRFGIPLPVGRRAGEARRRVWEAIEAVGASAVAGRPVGELSGGEQQRLLMAQVLVRRPRLLLLDEPLDSLDLAAQVAVASLLERLRRGGLTVVLVAHDVNPVLPYVDQVVYLARGRAVAGPADLVVTTGTLSALYEADVEVLRTSDGRLVVVGVPEPPAVHADRHAP